VMMSICAQLTQGAFSPRKPDATSPADAHPHDGK
jgi:hypothetical protein